MLETLAITLINTYIAFTFQQYLEYSKAVHIEGAPSWYAQQTDEHICESGFAYGNLSALEEAKARTQDTMVARLRANLVTVVNERFGDRSDPAERALVQRFTHDENLPQFIAGNVRPENVEYRKKNRIAYARSCLGREKLIAYHQARLAKIHRELALHRRDRAFRDMEDAVEAPAWNR